MARLSLDAIAALAFEALVASKVGEGQARTVAASLAEAEGEGIPSHGLLRLPVYCSHARSGKVDGFATPTIGRTAPGALAVDACGGFAHPAIDMGLHALAPLARAQGIAVLTIRNSYNSGVMGHHVARLAREGLIGLAFANAPATIAPAGGKTPVFGTNPVAMAVPRVGGEPMVLDQAASVVARGEVILRAREGRDIPPSWGLDSRGEPTTDPGAVLDGGSMAPAGGYKGVGLALLVEVLAAALTGASFSFDAGSLTADDGKPAGVGQLFIAMDPALLGPPGFGTRIEALCAQMLAQEGVRLPGSRRAVARSGALANGVIVDDALLAEALAIAQGAHGHPHS